MMKFLATIAVAALALTGHAATAATPADIYVAVPATLPGKTSFITRSTIWRLQNAAFVARAAPERPAVLCELVARQVGTLNSFSVAGKAYDPEQLAKCNAKAKKG